MKRATLFNVSTTISLISFLLELNLSIICLPTKTESRVKRRSITTGRPVGGVAVHSPVYRCFWFHSCKGLKRDQHNRRKITGPLIHIPLGSASWWQGTSGRTVSLVSGKRRACSGWFTVVSNYHGFKVFSGKTINDLIRCLGLAYILVQSLQESYSMRTVSSVSSVRD
jgi:hypothetical protein